MWNRKQGHTSRDGLQKQVADGIYRQTTENRLVLGGFALLLTVGGVLAAVLLGPTPAAIVVAIILLAATLILILYKGLEMMEAWLKRSQ